MLNRLFGPKLDDANPERRLAALDALSDPTAEVLSRLAREDPDERVRKRAIARLDDAEILLRLMEREDCFGAARDRLTELLPDDARALALVHEASDLATVRNLLDAAMSEPHWRPLLERVSEPEVLAEIALHHRAPAVRSAAAERISDESLIRDLERRVRNRDGDLARSLRTRLDALRHARTEIDSIDARIAQLAREVQQIARSEDEPTRQARLDWIEQQRHESVDQRQSHATVFEAFQLTLPDAPDALSDLDATLVGIRTQAEEAAQREQEEQAQRAHAAAMQRRTEATLKDAESALAEFVAGLDRHPDLSEAVSALRKTTVERQASWDAVCTEHTPTDGQIEQWNQHIERVRETEAALDRLTATQPQAVAFDTSTEPLLDRIPRSSSEAEPLWHQRQELRNAVDAVGAALAEYAWPRALPAPTLLRDLFDAEKRGRSAIQAIDTLEKGLLDRIGKLMGRVERTLDQRKLRPAAGMYADLERQFAAVPAPGAKLRERFEEITTRVQELRDWEQFATAPKRNELVEQIERLAETASDDAAQRADQVRDLRSRWQALGPARGEDGKRMAARFDAAAEKAFEPARTQFDAENSRRAENTENRQRICNEVESFLASYDWDAPDWKAVERIYRHAGNEWQKYADVDSRGRGLGRRYHHLTRDLRARLEARWKENIARKESLIEQAQALVSDEGPVANAARTARDLQDRWKSVDITPRSADRDLWKQFRTACDAVFEGLQAARAGEEQAHQSAIDALQAATSELGSALDSVQEGSLDPSGLREALPTHAVEDALRNLRGLRAPGSLRKATDRAIRAAEGNMQSVRDLLRSATNRQQRAHLRSALEYDRDRVRAEIAGEPAPALPDTLVGRYGAAIEARTAQPEMRRAATVDLELIANVESPPDDAALRMERNVARLSAGMRGETDASNVDAQVEEILLRVLACAATEPGDEALATRALTAFDAID